VLGYAQLLQLDEVMTERQRKGLATIEASGGHLLALIDDILDLARIESGKLDIAPAPIALPAFLELVADIVRVRAEQNGLDFVLDAPPPLPEGVLGDERRLRQVLLNLLGNAVKFTSAGHVTLRVRARPQGDKAWALAFAIEDTGIGMTANELQRVFRPFEQAGSAQQRAEGVGLGLAISEALVHQMGGRIDVQSEPGRGSRFSFELVLPRARAADETVPGLLVTGYLGSRRRVLVVDDARDNRAMLVDLLKALDFYPAEAANGTQALMQARVLRPDLILIDNAMPEPSGNEVIRQLRTEDAFARVPIIAVTAGASVEDRARGLDAGANVFLPKPVEVGELLKAIGDVLDLSWTYRTPPAGEPPPGPA